ncbi:hypothetical protein B5F41_13590, partial [Gordonibacter sp. An232A]
LLLLPVIFVNFKFFRVGFKTLAHGAPTAAGTSDAPKELLRELCDHSRALAFAKLTKRPQRAILGS